MNQGTNRHRLTCWVAAAFMLSSVVASSGCMNWSAPRQVPVDPTARPLTQVPQPSSKTQPRPIPPKANGVALMPRTVARHQPQGAPAPVVQASGPSQGATPQTLRIPSTVGLPQAPNIAYPVTPAGGFQPNLDLARSPITHASHASHAAPAFGSISDDSESVGQPQVTPLAPLPEDDPLLAEAGAAQTLQRMGTMFSGADQLPPLPHAEPQPVSPGPQGTPLGPIPVTQEPAVPARPTVSEPPAMDLGGVAGGDPTLPVTDDVVPDLPALPEMGPAPDPATFAPADVAGAAVPDAAAPDAAGLNATSSPAGPTLPNGAEPNQQWPRTFEPASAAPMGVDSAPPDALDLPDVSLPDVSLPGAPLAEQADPSSSNAAMSQAPAAVAPQTPPDGAATAEVARAESPQDSDTNNSLRLPPDSGDGGPSPSDVATPEPPPAVPPVATAAESFARTLSLLRQEAEENRAGEQDLRLLQLLEVVVHPEAKWPAKSPADEAWKRLATAAALQLRETESHRARAEVKRAYELLHADAPLRLNNLAFCRQIDDFGIYAEFKSSGFQPGQELLLYVEVENFTHTKSPNGMVVEIKGGYEIVNSEGTVLDSRDFLADKQTFRRERRDYYVPYRLFVPKDIPNGDYTLKLKLIDGASNKTGEGTIALPIRARR